MSSLTAEVQVPSTPEARPLGFRPGLDGFYDVAPQLQYHIYQRAEEQFAKWERHKDAFTTAAEVQTWQRWLRQEALRALGGLPESDAPLAAETVGRLDQGQYTIENVIFQSLPGVHVTTNLYLPKGLSGPTGAVLFLCGHGEAAKATPIYQAVCQRLARNGLVVLAVDCLGQGERKGYLDAQGNERVRWGTTEHSYAGYQCWQLGHSIARYFMQDARRALDYLERRPEVDPRRIGVTGASGGGTQSAWLMLIEPRLAAAAPVNFLTTRRNYMWAGQGQDAEQHLLGGTLAGIDHEDCLIAMAPRPVRMLAVESDFFSPEGVVRAFERARRAYALLGQQDRLELVRTPGTHAYRPPLAKAATEFFARELLGRREGEIDHREPEPLPIDDLNCTRSGQVLLDDPATRRVFDLNHAAYRDAQQPAASAGEARAWLSEVVNRQRRPAPFFVRWLPGPACEGAQVQHSFWWSETDVLNAGVLLQPSDGQYDRLLLAVLDRGTDDLDAWRDRLLERVQQGEAVLALDVRGTGALAPREITNARNPPYITSFKLATELLWLDDSMAAMQVYDILRAVAMVRSEPELGLGERPLGLLGSGLGGFLGLLATALEPRIARLELDAPPFDLDRLLSERYYAEAFGWPHPRDAYLLPGLALQQRWQRLQELVADRLVIRQA
jgi:cephalosporin-C deacetylase-like acetyl esterase